MALGVPLSQRESSLFGLWVPPADWSEGAPAANLPGQPAGTLTTWTTSKLFSYYRRIENQTRERRREIPSPRCVINSRRLKGPYLVVAVQPLPELDFRAVSRRDTIHIQTRSRRAIRGDPVGSGVGEGELVELLRAGSVIIQLHLGPLACVSVVDVHCLAALHPYDLVIAAAGVGHSPLLVGPAAVGPLLDLRAVGGSIAAGIHRLAAVLGDDFIRAVHGLEQPLLGLVAIILPQPDIRAIIRRTADDTQGGVRRAIRGNPIISTVGRNELVLLTGAVPIVPELHLRSVGGATVGEINIQGLAALDPDDFVGAGAGVGDNPLLVGAASVGQLVNLRAVAGSVVVGFHRLAAVPGDELIGAVGHAGGDGAGHVEIIPGICLSGTHGAPRSPKAVCGKVGAAVGGVAIDILKRAVQVENQRVGALAAIHHASDSCRPVQIHRVVAVAQMECRAAAAGNVAIIINGDRAAIYSGPNAHVAAVNRPAGGVGQICRARVHPEHDAHSAINTITCLSGRSCVF